MRRLNAFALLSAVALVGCVDGTGPVFCDTAVHPAVAVFVRDDATGASIGSGSTMILRDGSFVDSTAYPAGSPGHDAAPLATSSSFERPGTYEVTVRRAGYADWQQAGIRVTQGTCHVRTVELTARLTALP